MSTVGERLREERKRLGLSQTAFAKAVGVHLNTQSRYEKGDREPDTAYLEAAGNVGVDATYVLTGWQAGIPDEETEHALVRSLTALDSDSGGTSSRDDVLVLFLDVLGISREDWLEIVKRCLRRGPNGAAGMVTFDPAWRGEVAKASRLISCLVESASTLDSALLAAALEGLDQALSVRGATMVPARKAQAVAMLYRAFKASGKVDPAMIDEAVTLVAG